MEKLPISEIDNKYERARKRVEDIKGFYYNLYMSQFAKLQS